MDPKIAPLATRMRPESFEEIVGQDHILSPSSALRRSLEAGSLFSVLFWGPPGSGKTTIAQLIAKYSRYPFESFSAVLSGVRELREIIDSAKKRNIITSEQSIKESLFQTLNQNNIEQPLNILIGAKKFIEGWDNYRISSMLLMNFAKSKGVSAIQLFGRGVRLHGYNNSMKRSKKLLGEIQ